ncbi:hypothetical protein [Vandammella animalimorsus]|uniref:hypothetical protein n=1 Tax=Vandammella animalimorsus TaxID=2029117 RepID=UPI0011774E0A|nr:hypothetical protein [Vandammella animalimorsus]
MFDEECLVNTLMPAELVKHFLEKVTIKKILAVFEMREVFWGVIFHSLMGRVNDFEWIAKKAAKSGMLFFCFGA